MFASDQKAVWETAGMKPLDEALWEAWKTRGRAQDERRRAKWGLAVQSVSVVGLLVAAGVWSDLAPWEVVVRSIVTAGSFLVMLQSVRSGNYAVAGVFGVLALAYNPVAPMFRFSGDWQRAVVLASIIPFIASFYWQSKRMPRVPERRTNGSGAGLSAALLLLGFPALLCGGELAKYRNFQLGTDLSTVLTQTASDPAGVKAIHTRPHLIQELEWRPGGGGTATEQDAVKDLRFRFYDRKLFQIVVNYDRYATEGMTVADFIAAISGVYGTAVKPSASIPPLVDRYNGPEEVVAQWQDPQHRYDLIRSGYGPTFRLVGTLKSLEMPAEGAIQEAARLDDVEAPEREAARLASEEAAVNSRLDKARLVNKPKFRP